ncbi:MAG: hypothetical protein O6920_06230 [Chloroflexi bacterium]|nr:hypothetical protein [Chloroflexota bacterium]
MPPDNDPLWGTPDASTVRRVRKTLGAIFLTGAIIWIAAGVIFGAQGWPVALIIGGYGAYLLLKSAKGPT